MVGLGPGRAAVLIADSRGLRAWKMQATELHSRHIIYTPRLTQLDTSVGQSAYLCLIVYVRSSSSKRLDLIQRLSTRRRFRSSYQIHGRGNPLPQAQPEEGHGLELI